MKGEHCYIVWRVTSHRLLYQTGLISVVKLHGTNAGHKFKI